MNSRWIAIATGMSLTVIPTLAIAEDVTVIEPEVRAWVMEQNGPPVDWDGTAVVGEALPGTVTAIEVPRHSKYRFVRTHKQRIVIDAETGKVLAVY